MREQEDVMRAAASSSGNRALRSGLLSLLAGLAVSCGNSAAWAADASALGTTLTAVGGDKKANKDGTIPAWVAERQDGSEWTPKKFRGDAWAHKGEKPLLSIESANVDKYAEKLSAGEVALLKQVKGYRVDIYPTHRSCSVPDFVAENTKKNVDAAQLGADGWTLKDAVVPGIPFPMPQSGVQAMWNLKMRYRGVGVNYTGGTTNVSPHKGGSEWIVAGYQQSIFWPWGMKGSRKLSEIGATYSQTYFGYTNPVALAGQAGSFSDFINQPGTESYYYFPGQRRVRRLPSYAYDSPQLGFENQYAMDETLVFSGALDRFDWKLVGKKELYVPYNSFGAFDFAAKQSDVLQADFVAASHRRYELHRVWVVEASVKSGVRHTSPKRIYYLDEDSWNVVLAEDYDAQGKLWKVREGYLIPVYETGSCDVTAFAQYNLAEGRYLVDFHAIGTGSSPQWYTEPSNPRFKTGFYTAENLRAISDR